MELGEKSISSDPTFQNWVSLHLSRRKGCSYWWLSQFEADFLNFHCWMKAKKQILEINLTLVSFLPYETEKKSQEGRKSGECRRECPCNYVITEDPGIVVDSLVFSGIVAVPLTLQEATFFLTGCFWAGVMASGGLNGQKCAQGSWGVGTERKVHSMLFLCNRMFSAQDKGRLI